MTWFCDESCILILYYFAMCVMNVIYNWLLSAGLSVPLHAVWTSWCGPQYVKMISLTVCPAPMYGRRDVDCSPSRRFPWVFRRSGGSCYRQLWSTPRQQSGRAPMLGRVYSCKEQRQMYMSRNAQQTAFTLRKPPGGCSDVYHQAMECYDPYAERSQVSVDPNTGMPQVVIRRYSCE